MAAFGAISPCPVMPAHYHSVSLARCAESSVTTRFCARAVALIVSGALRLEFVRALLIGRAQTMNTGIHNFMDSSASRTRQTIRSRRAASTRASSRER